MASSESLCMSWLRGTGYSHPAHSWECCARTVTCSQAAAVRPYDNSGTTAGMQRYLPATFSEGNFSLCCLFPP